MKGAQMYVALRNGEMPGFTVIDRCPICGEESETVQCRWCGVNIAQEEERLSKIEAEEYLRHEKAWKGAE